MTLRYFSNLGLALLAGFVVVATQAFAAPTVEWLTFAAGVAFALAGAAMLPRRGGVHRALNGATAVLGGLIIIESLLTAGSTTVWLSFAGGLGVLAVAIAGLTVHELSTERVVHSLEVAPSGRPERTGVAG
jgi:hypothetical protein